MVRFDCIVTTLQLVAVPAPGYRKYLRGIARQLYQFPSEREADITPTEALEAELCAEARALARRLGSGQMPDAIVIRVEMDRETGMPRTVDCQEERKRRVLNGGTIASRAKRCETAA